MIPYATGLFSPNQDHQFHHLSLSQLEWQINHFICECDVFPTFCLERVERVKHWGQILFKLKVVFKKQRVVKMLLA